MAIPKTLDAWLSYIETLHPHAIDLGLERVRAVQQHLHLERPGFAVITVAGTNGKGSSVAMLEAILQAAGYRVGAYTSPHLLAYNERVRVATAVVTDAELCAAFTEVEAARAGVPLTYFEFGTLAALQIFHSKGIDIAVLEVGLGGRLDAVNVLEADVALLTSVDLDHTEWLGGDRQSIGGEKAGIFHAGRPAVCGDPAPPDSIRVTAAKVGAPLFQLGQEFGYTLESGYWSWWGPYQIRSGLSSPAMPGRIQVRNAAGVLMVLNRLAGYFPVTHADIRTGLKHTALPGRFQTLPGVPLRVLDVAHNPEAARVLRENLAQQEVAGETIAVCAMLRDKPVVDVLRVMAPLVHRWYVAPLDNPRGATAGEMRGFLLAAGVRVPIETHGDIKGAYDLACAQASPADRVIVFGSFAAVGVIIAA